MTWFLIPFLGTRLDLINLDAIYCGAPFCYVPADYPVDLLSADAIYCGAPFVSYSRG